jgi:hypothetical protein
MVAIMVAWVIHTATVVLSAPITPVLHTPQDESKRAKQAQCRGGIVYTGNDIVGASDKREAQSGDECVQKQRVVASGELQPYTAMLALEGHGTSALLELPCNRSMGCGLAALEPLGQDGKEQWSILAPGLTVTDADRVEAAFTSIRSKALTYAGGEDFTKFTLDREAFTQLGSALSSSVTGDGTNSFPWDRLFNLGPLLLLFLEKLLGRL